MNMCHQTITPRETDTASVFLGVIVESYLFIAFVYYLFYNDLATAIHVNALGHRLTVELTTVEGVLIIIIHLSVIR